jgi:hypothetical protein
MRKVRKPLFIVLILIFGLFATYIFKYQQLINDGSVIADAHCLKVNPLIIERKNKYLDSMKVIQASGGAEAYWKETESYLAVSKKYISAEEEWLEMQKKYMDRWDFNLLIPYHIKQAAQYQYEEREADRNSTDTLVKLFQEKDPVIQKQLSGKVIDETNRGKKADDEYNKIWDAPRTFDIRNYITKVPPSKCPAENFDIPNIDIQDIFNPAPEPENNSSSPIS